MMFILPLVAMVLFSLFFLLFLVGRYRKFSTNVYVIHWRHGRIKYAGLGGTLYKLPLIDEVKVLPASVQSLAIEATGVQNKGGYMISASMSILWKVMQPDIAYNAFSWQPSDANFVETILKKHASHFLTRALASTGKEIEESREDTKARLASSIANQLTTMMEKHGIGIESVTIDTVTTTGGLAGHVTGHDALLSRRDRIT